jgi:hypothetical protein
MNTVSASDDPFRPSVVFAETLVRPILGTLSDMREGAHVTSALIGSRDVDKFERYRAEFPRLIRPLQPEEKRVPPKRLTDVVTKHAKNLAAERQRGLWCLGISVDDRDGQTWAAASVAAALEEQGHDGDLVVLQGQMDHLGLPLLVGTPTSTGALVSRKKIIARADRRGLLEGLGLRSGAGRCSLWWPPWWLARSRPC